MVRLVKVSRELVLRSVYQSVGGFDSVPSNLDIERCCQHTNLYVCGSSMHKYRQTRFVSRAHSANTCSDWQATKMITNNHTRVLGKSKLGNELI